MGIVVRGRKGAFAPLAARLVVAAAIAGCGASDRGRGGVLVTGDDAGRSDGSAARLDGAAARDSGPAPPSCQGADLLFVIDNSVSMRTPQMKLASAFPTFVDAMFDRLPSGIELHVGITTSSFFTGSTSESTINCRSGNTPADIEAHYIPPTQMNDGENGGQGRLFQYAGKSYFTANTAGDRQPLKDWFSQAAVAVGERGSSFEMHAAGAAYVAHPANQATNQGFLRDAGTVLVIVLLADEPDKSRETVPTYHDMIVAAKKQCGGDKCVLTAGLLNPCVEKNPPDLQWEFLSSFGKPPTWGAITDQTSYTRVIGDALAQVVKQTCDEIVIQ